VGGGHAVPAIHKDGGGYDWLRLWLFVMRCKNALHVLLLTAAGVIRDYAICIIMKRYKNNTTETKTNADGASLLTVL
jgi:hypothetical protein